MHRRDSARRDVIIARVHARAGLRNGSPCNWTWTVHGLTALIPWSNSRVSLLRVHWSPRKIAMVRSVPVCKRSVIIQDYNLNRRCVAVGPTVIIIIRRFEDRFREGADVVRRILIHDVTLHGWLINPVA